MAIRKMTLKRILATQFLMMLACLGLAQQKNHKATVVGEMRKVMREGRLQGIVDLDTISDKSSLYGLGPLEYLRGEILVFDGVSYLSTVVSETEMKVEETYGIKAPFFGYANIEKWQEHPLPDNVRTIKQLEEYLDKEIPKSGDPFFFKLSGKVESAKIHIVNLPPGMEVRSHKDAHQGLVTYDIENQEVDILGFFSREHQGIFTHHGSYSHMHLITKDRKQMGHLDVVSFDEGRMKLYLPGNLLP